MTITNKEDHRAELKRLTDYEVALTNSLSALSTGKIFTIEVGEKVVKFRDENGDPISELERPEGFISDQLNKSLDTVDAMILEANASYAALPPQT